MSLWTGTVLIQVPVNPSLYLIKYEAVDCVYGLEIFKDRRVENLQMLDGQIDSFRAGDSLLADRLLGRAVGHMFEQDDGSKDEWRGLVLSRAPVMPTWFFITYEKDPTLYMYQLMQDYKDGDLRILPDSGVCPSVIDVLLVFVWRSHGVTMNRMFIIECDSLGQMTQWRSESRVKCLTLWLESRWSV